jgi:hypothetical protein
VKNINSNVYACCQLEKRKQSSRPLRKARHLGQYTQVGLFLPSHIKISTQPTSLDSGMYKGSNKNINKAIQGS